MAVLHVVCDIVDNVDHLLFIVGESTTLLSLRAEVGVRGTDNVRTARLSKLEILLEVSELERGGRARVSLIKDKRASIHEFQTTSEVCLRSRDL